MRLIDGNKQERIIEELENICINAPEHVKDLLADLKNQPTVCDIEQIRAEIEHWESDDTQDDYQMGAMDMQKYILRVIDKYREEQTDAT